jgi:two-component system chemotaxis response regulator CheY
VVDEDRDLCQLYAVALAGFGYQVDAAADGAAAWEVLQSKIYNLLITENDLPKLKGVDLVRKVRAARMALPVVMASGDLPTHELAHDPSLQVAATLLKPFILDEMLHTVQHVLRATDAPQEQSAPPNWQSQPPADGWQL